MITGKKATQNIRAIIFYGIMFTLSLAWLYPYIWLFLSSFKPWNEIYTTLIPAHFTLKSYSYILTVAKQMGYPFLLGLFNSIFISVTVTVSVVMTSAIVGYAVAKIQFSGAKTLFNFVIYQMLFPGFMFTVPLYIVVRSFGLLDTYSAMILPSMMSAWGVFMFSQSFKSIPNNYIEAAKIDGANFFWIVFNVMVPLSKSTMAIVSIFTFIGIWDNFMWPLIVIQNHNKMPLAVLLAVFSKSYGNYVGPILAGSVIQTIPMVIIFVIFRKYFLQGISMSFK